jgi:sugar lactone lactonase YvrE
MNRLCATAAVVLLCSAGVLQAQTSPAITSYTLPGEEVYPEGVAFDQSTETFYVGSTNGGTIYRGRLQRPEAEVLAPAGANPDLTAAFGMKVDPQGRLWVAGGRTGKNVVLDARTGRQIKAFAAPNAAASFFNDVAVTGDGAYFTDSTSPVLWRVPTRDGIGELEPWLDLKGTPIEYATGQGREGVNLNGIVAAPDGSFLIVVQMNKGKLFRIGTADKQVREINVEGGNLRDGDGLVLDGTTLFVSRIGANEIVTLDLSQDLTSATVRARFTDPIFSFPATVAKAGDRLLVVNTQFDKRAAKNPDLPFRLLAFPIAAVASGRSR